MSAGTERHIAGDTVLKRYRRLVARSVPPFHRDVTRDPKSLRPHGARAVTESDPASVRSAIDLIRSPGWLASGWVGGRAGWIQRTPRGWGSTLLALVGAFMGQWSGSDPDRNGDGWLMIDVATNDRASGSIVEIRGELDQGMELAVGRMLLDLTATVQRRWDPTEQVDDDLLPGTV